MSAGLGAWHSELQSQLEASSQALQMDMARAYSLETDAWAAELKIVSIPGHALRLELMVPSSACLKNGELIGHMPVVLSFYHDGHARPAIVKSVRRGSQTQDFTESVKDGPELASQWRGVLIENVSAWLTDPELKADLEIQAHAALTMDETLRRAHFAAPCYVAQIYGQDGKETSASKERMQLQTEVLGCQAHGEQMKSSHGWKLPRPSSSQKQQTQEEQISTMLGGGTMVDWKTLEQVKPLLSGEVSQATAMLRLVAALAMRIFMVREAHGGQQAPKDPGKEFNLKLWQVEEEMWRVADVALADVPCEKRISRLADLMGE
jgi:hypothetical protein